MGLLVAFDFDHTIVDDNSDIVVKKLVPSYAITSAVQNLYKSDGWTAYMQEIFNLLHKFNISETTIQKTVCDISPVPGVIELIEQLHNLGWEIIIISDANSYFIEYWLRHNKLHEKITQVFTNPAKFVKGRLCIKKYHVQDWCNLSTKNLCKGYILEKYIENRKCEGVEFNCVSYVGDGQNDLCPSVKLPENGFVFPRISYRLHEILQTTTDHNVIAQIVPWRHGSDILQVLKSSLANNTLVKY